MGLLENLTARGFGQPILYLPMTDKATAHTNLGTGGDFVQNGLIETADRGANQDNCVASYFDGVDDYLSSTGIGAVDGKQFTFNCTFTPQSLNTSKIVFSNYTGTTYGVYLYYDSTGMWVACRNSAGDMVLYSEVIADVVIGKNYSVSISFDAELSAYIAIVNGELSTLAPSTLVNDNLALSTNWYGIGKYSPSATYTDAEIGEVYFDTNYIDLATNNPFWIED